MRPQTKAGFTLVELLVSITILSIMLLSIAQAIGFVSQIWLNGVGTVDNYGKARVIMNILDRDVQQMVMRPDVAAFVDNSSPPKPACAFYTNVQGSPGIDTRAVSLVQYVPNSPGLGSIQRLNYGMNFATTSGIVPALVTPPSSGVPPTASLSQLSNVTATGTETLASGVICFQWQFVDGGGNILTPPYNFTYTPAGTTNPVTVTTPFFYDYTAPTSATNPRAVIISILVLSNSAYQFAAQNPTILTKLQTDFPTTLPTSSTNQTFSQYWNGILNPATGSLDSSLPPPVRGGLKVFERYIPLPVVTPTS